MRVIITGAAGFLGRKLTQRLVADGALDGRPITDLALFDTVPPATPADAPFRVGTASGDVADPQAMSALFQGGADVVYHLAAVVSGQAEAEFDLGMRVNLDGTRLILEAARRLGTAPKVIFASSLAVFGGGAAMGVIRDDTPARPETSYGMQKAAGELLVNDYARKGFVDGRSLRLPTIVVRPGAPNAAASGFMSSIVREPLQGKPAICPVEVRTEMWVLSPRRVVDAFLHAVAIPADAWAAVMGAERALSLPGQALSVAEMIEALRAVGGDRAANFIRWEPDEKIRRIVQTWPARFAPDRALALGFRADPDALSIVRAFAEDELGRTRFV